MSRKDEKRKKKIVEMIVTHNEFESHKRCYVLVDMDEKHPFCVFECLPKDLNDVLKEHLPSMMARTDVPYTSKIGVFQQVGEGQFCAKDVWLNEKNKLFFKELANSFSFKDGDL